MDFNIIKARGSNKLLGLLIAFQLAMLLVIGILLVQLLTLQTLPFTTTFSSVFLILICLPLSLYLSISAPDGIQKKIFLSFAATFTILTVSGIFWDIVPMAFTGLDMVPLAKILTLLAYVPFIIALVSVLRDEPMNVRLPIKAFIAFFNVAAAAVILILVAINLSGGSSNTLDTAIYTSSTIADIAIFSLCSILALNFMQNQLRYVFLIMLVFFMFSLSGDALSLLGALGWQGFSGLVPFLWDMMFVLTAIALIVFALNRDMDVTTVEEVNRTLHDTKSLMGDLIMQAPEAIGIFDAEGDAVMANPSFRQITSESTSGVPGKINLFRDDSRLMGASQELARIRDGGTFNAELIKSPGTGGEPDRYYQMKASPTHDSDGKITGYIVILADITDRRKREEELVRAKTQAELYLDLMSHDINNMNQIGIGFLEMALDRKDQDHEVQMMIRKPLEAMQNSSHLIDNVKKIRRADIGSSCLEPVDLGVIMDEVIRDYNVMPGRDTMIEYAPVKGYYVLANPLLRDVFSNLINNSFKHSTGPLKIWIKIASEIHNGLPYYGTTIEDNGPGIPPEARRVLQEHTYSFRKRASGRGLGLYLVKVLVDSYKGIITVEDRDPGLARSGTRIKILLPAKDNVIATGSAQPLQGPEISARPG